MGGGVIEKNTASQFSVLVYEMTEIVREEIGLKESLAARIAEAIVHGMQKRNGGQKIYIHAPDKTQRDEAIRHEFNGCNLDEVMRRHNVSRATVYRICK